MENIKSNFEVMQSETGAIIKSWTKHVAFEEEAKKQLLQVSTLPFIFKWVAAMPDVHAGKGTTVGSVIPTRGAIIPAAVGVDIGCGMIAQKTSLKADQLPDNLKNIRQQIERKIPVGFGMHRKIPKRVEIAWTNIMGAYHKIEEKHPLIATANKEKQLGTLGGGNHFVEVCLDEEDFVWIMLHSGSRGVGNRIGSYFIEKAKEEMLRWMIQLPDANLAYLPEGSKCFDDYIEAVHWAQNYAFINRELMMAEVLDTFRYNRQFPEFELLEHAVNCHHNYVEKEHHFGENIFVTRKGAVRARSGDLGIIPGSMGAKSFIVEGLGNRDSFHSCSHGAGRMMSRSKARQTISVEDHIEATLGVECRKDSGVIDESPKAYKNIDDVMQSQVDLVKIRHTLKQIVCVKG